MNGRDHHREARTEDWEACRQVVLDLPWLANGSLSEARAREVREHLICCTACRRELRETRAVLELFDEVGQSRPVGVARVLQPARWLRLPAGAPAALRWAAAILALLGSAYLYVSIVPGFSGPTLGENLVADVPAERPAEPDQGILFRDGFESRDLTYWSQPDDPASRN